MKSKTIPESCFNIVEDFLEIRVKSDEQNIYNWGIPLNYNIIVYHCENAKSSLEEYLLDLKELQRDINKQINIYDRIFQHYDSNYNSVNKNEKEYNIIFDSCRLARSRIEKLIENVEKKILNKDNINKYPLLFEVLEIKTYLKDLSSTEEKLSFLNYLLDELIDISYHYKDVDIETVLNQNNLQTKYTRRRYLSDFETFDEDCEYKYLKNLLIGTVIPFIEKEIMKYKNNQKINFSTTENIEIPDVNDKPNEAISKKIIFNPIRLHWQSDNILIPYLLERLFQEGFINNSDFELRRDFIEQSFYKKNGSIFSAKEAGSAESNYKLNTESKPKNSHKVDRAIVDLKSKRDELIKKESSGTKKK